MNQTAETDPNCISYWFPLIEKAGLPVPRTVIIPVEDAGILDWVYEGTPENAPVKLFGRIAEEAEKLGYPVFLRSGHTSGKHEWRDTCFLPNKEAIPEHVAGICQYSEMASMLGLPYKVFAVRELLPTMPAFTAFRGMPICREFRFFVNDGNVSHFQPYWPPDSIDGHTDDPLWREKLSAMNTLDAVSEFPVLMELVVKVSAAVPGFWSVDLLETERGWYITDMAKGDESFRWEP